MATEYIYDPVVTEEKFLVIATKLGYKPDKTCEESTETHYPIDNGHNYIWVNVHNKNVSFTRFGGNDDSILYEIADELGVGCWCEHDEEFGQILDQDGEEELHGKYITISIDDLMAMGTEVLVVDQIPLRKTH